LLSHLPTPTYQVGASLPSFAVAFVLTWLAGLASRRVPALAWLRA